MRKRRSGPERLPIIERILPNIVVKKACFEWRGVLHHGTRAVIQFNGNSRFVARIIYEIAYGPIPKGIFVCHTCDNPKCVRPSHLFLGTAMDNAHDMCAKGRHKSVRGQNHSLAKLTDTKVVQIRKLCARRINQRKIALQYAISPALVTMIKQRKVWSHI